MKIERMEILGIDVRDIDSAKLLFSNLLGVEFVEYELGVDVPLHVADSGWSDPSRLSAQGTRIAIDKSGYLELIQSSPPVARDGFRNIHFKVYDIDAAMEEMKNKGIPLVSDLTVGGLREAVYDADELHGMRICLVAYDAPTLVDAVMQDS